MVYSGETAIPIIQDLDLSIKQGETLAILGVSGSGKTTLLTLLAGLDVATRGEIYFQGQPLSRLSEEQRALLRAQYVGFIFQSFQLLPRLTALENVMLPLELQYMPLKQAKQQASDWLAEVGLTHRLRHYPTQLSGGEQQRVAIARAFVNMPKVIFADEMTGNLDPHTGEHIADIIFNCNKVNQTTLVLVTHDNALAARCERRLLLKEGRLTPC
jgi:putative ABC transport system ATP-binding protein